MKGSQAEQMSGQADMAVRSFRDALALIEGIQLEFYADGLAIELEILQRATTPLFDAMTWLHAFQGTMAWDAKKLATPPLADAAERDL